MKKYLLSITAVLVLVLLPAVMAQAFAGMFFSYALVEELFGDSIAPELSREELIAQFVDIFMNGTICRRG